MAAIGFGSPGYAETFELETASISEIKSAMDAGALSSVDLVSLYLNRLAIYDQAGVTINAVPVINPALLAEAAAADALRAKGTVLGPFHGVALLVKDNMDVAGLPTTNGYVELIDSIPDADAFVVKQLRDAGAVILGKSNMPDGAGATSVSSYAGVTKNPYGLDYVAGGSSTGSGAGVAANFATIALGSDSAGSLISPAAANNIYTLTPSLGLVGRTGIFPGADWRNVAGIYGRSAGDVAISMNEIDADDPNELYRDFFAPFVPTRGVDYTSQIAPGALAGKKIGIYQAYFPGNFPSEIVSTFDRFVDELRAAGATVVDYSGARPVVPTPSTATVLFDRNVYFQNLPESAPANNVAEFTQLLVPRLNTQATADQVRALFDANGLVPWQQNQSLLDYRAARLQSFEAIQQSAFVEQDFDALINPATTNQVPLYAPTATVSPAGTAERWTGFPLMIVPAGFDSNGLPIGMQFVGAAGGESMILALADAYAAQADYRKAPALTPALPGETIESSPSQPPIPADARPEFAPPALRVAANGKVTGRGTKSALVLTGKALDASGLRTLKIYVNGKKVAAKKARNWKASVKLTALRKLKKTRARTVSVQVVAKDIYGNTSATTKTVKLPNGA